MRRGIGHLLNTSGQLSRLTTTSDGMGGYTEQWQPVTSVRCRLSAPNPAVRDAAAAGSARITHDVYVLAGVDVRRGDRITARDLTLTVLSVVEPSEPVYRKAECTSDQYQ